MNTIAEIRSTARALRAASIARLRNAGSEVTFDTLVDDVIASLEIYVVCSAPGSRLLGTARAKLDRVRQVIIVDRTLPDEQRRFSTAHEVGHFVLEQPEGADAHADVSSPACGSSEVDEAPVGDRFPIGEAYVTGYGPRQRREVNASLFAAELLAPVEEVVAAFVQGLSATEIGARHGVSPTVIHGQLSAGLLSAEAMLSEAALERGDRDRGHATPRAAPVAETSSAPPVPSTGLSLHPKQREAMQAFPGPVAVDAGPGTGKTRTLTERVVHLVRERSVRPDQVLGLTFSNKASEEMSARITRTLGEAVRVQTFHAFGLDVLRDYPSQAGIQNDVTLLDPVEAQALLELHLEDLGLDEYSHVSEPGLYFESILDAISRAKDEMVSPARYAELAATALAAAGADEKKQKAARRYAEVARVYDVYEQLLERHGLVDFGDLIYRVVRLFEAHPEVARREGERYPHVVVDEYQDVNRASARLLQLLRPDGRGLWVVGDVRQAIYRFRGASPRNFQGFRRDFPAAGEAIPLVRNYRSVPGLMPIFSSVAKAMAHAPGFADWESDRTDPPGPVVFATASDEDVETEGIATRILALEADEQGRSFGDFAVLCHRNQDVQRIARALEVRGIPVANFGEFFERPEVRDLLSVLELASGAGVTALQRVGQIAPHAIPPAELGALVAAATSADGGLTAVLKMAEPPVGVGAESFRLMRMEWQRLTQAAFRPGIWQFYTAYLFEDGRYLRPLLAEQTHGSRQRLLAVGQLLLLARAFDARQTRAASFALAAMDEAPAANDAVAPSFDGEISRVVERPSRQTLEQKREFLQVVRRLWGAKDRRVSVPVGAAAAVFVGTVHSSKGLEFPIVFVPFLAEGRFPFDPPHEFAPPPPGLVSEEEPNADEAELEALFFVAISRARDGLVLSVASNYGGKPAHPSRLLRLIENARASGLLADEKWERVEQEAGTTADRVRTPFNPETLNYRAYETFLGCPRRFFYRYVMNLPESDDGRAYLPYVVACRSALNWLEERHREGSLPIDWQEVEQAFGERWAAEGPVEHAHATFYRAEALRYVRREWERRKGQPTGAKWEGTAVAEVDGVRLTIPVESARREGNVLRVAHRYFRPYKASKKDYLEPRFALLRLAMAQTEPGETVVVEMHYPDKVVEVTPLQRRYEDARIEKFRAAVAQMRVGDFPPEPEDERARACPRCPYAFTCPA